MAPLPLLTTIHLHLISEAAIGSRQSLRRGEALVVPGAVGRPHQEPARQHLRRRVLASRFEALERANYCARFSQKALISAANRWNSSR